ncbi:hypothetical protein SB767_34225, partial [Bacillus sp. SIMBA_069]
ALASLGGADQVSLNSTAVRELLEQDLEALRAADLFLLVLPAGQAAHMEAGIAFGLSKPWQVRAHYRSPSGAAFNTAWNR